MSFITMWTTISMLNVNHASVTYPCQIRCTARLLSFPPL